MIPKVIYQTYKDPFDSLPEYMQKTSNSWKTMNPDYEHVYMDDSQASDFIKKEYGEKVYNLFINAPVGVMRGDMFRYLIIYKYGGIYADLDTLCVEPVSSWMKEDKSFIVCPEHQDHFCQWTFAATAGHPILKSVIDLMIDRMEKADYTKKHFVHYLTGPGMWTSGIMASLNLEDKDPEGVAHYDPEGTGLIENMLEFNESEVAKSNGFYCYAGDRWRIFHHTAVKHLYGSQNWNEGYVKWIEDPLVKGE